MMYDPLGNSEWRAFQAAQRFQLCVARVEEHTGRTSPLSDCAVRNAKKGFDSGAVLAKIGSVKSEADCNTGNGRSA